MIIQFLTPYILGNYRYYVEPHMGIILPINVLYYTHNSGSPSNHLSYPVYQDTPDEFFRYVLIASFGIPRLRYIRSNYLSCSLLSEIIVHKENLELSLCPSLNAYTSIDNRSMTL